MIWGHGESVDAVGFGLGSCPGVADGRLRAVRDAAASADARVIEAIELANAAAGRDTRCHRQADAEHR
jgi:hypothetical protein